LEGQAEGFAKLIAVAGSPEAAIQYLIVEQLPELTRIQVDAFKNIKFDNITVWDTGGNGAGSSTANFGKEILSMLPAFTDVYKNVTGKELPSMLQLTDSTVVEEVMEPLNESKK
jgi:flotillin